MNLEETKLKEVVINATPPDIDGVTLYKFRIRVTQNSRCPIDDLCEIEVYENSRSNWEDNENCEKGKWTHIGNHNFTLSLKKEREVKHKLKMKIKKLEEELKYSILNN